MQREIARCSRRVSAPRPQLPTRNRVLLVLALVVNPLLGCADGDHPVAQNGAVYALLIDEGGTMLDWSPDGERIAFYRYGLWIWMVSGSGGEVTHLGSGIGPSWSPDGQTIAYYLGTITGGVFMVYAVSDTGGPASVLSQGGHPDWSPTGDRIALDPVTSVDYPADGVFTVPVAGGEPFEVCPWGEYPDWAPDSDMIAFRTSRDCMAGIWVVPAEGGQPERITAGIHRRPRWSPDGIWIAYFIEYANQVWIVPSEGGTALELTGGPISKAWPTWSPGGERIAFSSYNDETGEWEIWIASNLPF
jgi:Tol biopolymer transport system component